MFSRLLTSRTTGNTLKFIQATLQRNNNNKNVFEKPLLSTIRRIEIIPAMTLVTKKNKKMAFFTWRSFVISSFILASFGGLMLYLKEEKMKKMERKRKKALGETNLGGKFELIDQHGNLFHSSKLEGKWVLLYFGFTHCPDVCPDELEKLVNVVDGLETTKGADPVQGVFITVDPDRDDVKAVREYLAEFSSKIIGLTGTKEQIHQATKSYRVYYSVGPSDHENDYIVDHTIITYLIDPEGNLVDYYGQTKTAEEMIQGVLKAMKTYKSLNKRLGFL